MEPRRLGRSRIQEQVRSKTEDNLEQARNKFGAGQDGVQNPVEFIFVLLEQQGVAETQQK